MSKIFKSIDSGRVNENQGRFSCAKRGNNTQLIIAQQKGLGHVRQGRALPRLPREDSSMQGQGFSPRSRPLSEERAVSGLEREAAIEDGGGWAGTLHRCHRELEEERKTILHIKVKACLDTSSASRDSLNELSLCLSLFHWEKRT